MLSIPAKRIIEGKLKKDFLYVEPLIVGLFISSIGKRNVREPAIS